MSTTALTPAAPSVGDAPAVPRLLVASLSHRWPRVEQPVLDDVELVLPAGTVARIQGRNGVGKTTLLRLLAGILDAQRGEIRIDGATVDAGRPDYMRKLGFLSAGDRGLQARLTVRQQLDLWARLAYVPRRERAGAIAAALAGFELTPRSGERVDRLSQGWRQRVRLAMCFLHEPRLLLLDEPANSLDDEGVEVLHAAMRGAIAGGASVVECTPREDGLATPTQRYRLRDGRLEPDA